MGDNVLVIFSNPTIQASDRVWIDAIRRDHDPQHALIEPHFTFVFPFTGVAVEDVLSHLGNVVVDTPTIHFRLSHTAAIRDVSGTLSHVFLLPTDGMKAMQALHARLYSGVLAEKLHPSIEFMPHVTVGAFDQHEDAEHLAMSIRAFDIIGVLETIHLATFDGVSITELHQLRFK